VRGSRRLVSHAARIAALALACIAAVALLGARPAFASGVWWHVSPSSAPTHLKPGGTAWLILAATNLGRTDASGATEPVTVTDVLPPGVTAIDVRAAEGNIWLLSFRFPFPECTLMPLRCSYKGILKPYERVWMFVQVQISPSADPGELNRVTVSGGGATASRKSVLATDGAPTQYGLEDFTITPEDDDGETVTQAGSHPFQLTTTVSFNKTERLPYVNPDESAPVQPALPKDVNVKLPPGLVGNPTPFPQCTAVQFSTLVIGYTNQCADDTAVGVANITIDEPTVFGYATFTAPIVNLAPARGEPARFGFTIFGAPVYLDTSVRTGGDYGVNVDASNISQLASVLETEVTLWGVPGDPRHDNSRGWGCTTEGEQYGLPCKPLTQLHPQPLLTLPTSCTGPLQASVETDSWKQRGAFLAYKPFVAMPALDGCNRLGFKPSVEVKPDTEAGSTPSGMTVNLHVPQDASLAASGLSEANVKDTTIALPEGLGLNPAAADGLLSCSVGQIGLENAAVPSCPDASKLGTVTIHSPLLPDPLIGAAYLAAQNANPFGSLVALYVVASEAKSGVLVKLAGEVHLSESGQIVATFKDTPQLPFEDFELHMFGGDRAPLATPASCGSYTTVASLTPWSGNEPVSAASTFKIASGPNGAPCASPLPFAPSLSAGTTSIQAGGLTPLTTTISRDDGQQDIQSLQLHMPPGLSGLLSGVELCGEAAANAGTCGPQGEIGETIVSVGLGGDPFSVTGGKVYLTGPYRGAPFGLSIVNPAKAGPFDLGRLVVRAKIDVDPHTAQLTVTTDPSGPYAIPHVLDGIPLQIKHVNVVTNRPGFTFNPTNCNPMALTGAIGSVQGAVAPVSVPFQVTNCAALGFKPDFKASVTGRTSRAGGAGLSVKLSYPKGTFGSQANIAKVKVELPKQLPSRLTTLQKACTNAQFEANPAGCPVASNIGHAKVTTPLLPVPLEGPAIFVSHGGEAFPSLTMVLQGYGVTVDLVGTTFINKAGVTSTTFKTVPDVPFNTFELTLPTGKYSALTALGSVCNEKLKMPSEFVAQNGLVIHRSTPIGVTGCAKKKALSRKQKLAAALKACHKKRGARRAGCERRARKRYGPVRVGKRKKS
jgi:uncharacterized repeat protein (TIGR01451 family)